MENIKIQPNWKKSKEQIWSEHFDSLTQSVHVNRKRFRFNVLYAAAAILIIFLVLPGLYVKTVTAEKGERKDMILPDGSAVTLNSESVLSYKPMLWFISRSLKLSGEALFEVNKGREFRVITVSGTVTVLGTSFNVYSRGDDLSVTCYTGKVAVSTEDKNVLLEKNKRFEFKSGVSSESYSESYVKHNSWIENRFHFESVNLKMVFEEIERQYNILITHSDDLDLIYSGSFDKPEKPQEILDIVTAPFNLSVRVNGNEFIIIKED